MVNCWSYKHSNMLNVGYLLFWTTFQTTRAVSFIASGVLQFGCFLAEYQLQSHHLFIMTPHWSDQTVEVALTEPCP